MNFEDGNWTLLTNDVVVAANNIQHVAALQGNFQTFGLTKDTPTSKKELKEWSPLGTRSADGGSAAGAGILVLAADDNVTAKIQNGVVLYAGSLEVDAETEAVLVSVVASGGKASETAFNGAFNFTVLVDETQAVIDNGATIEVGSGSVSDAAANGASVFVDATNTAILVTIAGSVAISESTGVGISAAGNIVVRDTEAYIGNRHDNNTAGDPQHGGRGRRCQGHRRKRRLYFALGPCRGPRPGRATTRMRGGNTATGIGGGSGKSESSVRGKLPNLSANGLFDLDKTKPFDPVAEQCRFFRVPSPSMWWSTMPGPMCTIPA